MGFHLGWSKGGTALALAYINDLGDSDTLQDVINAALGSNDISQHVPGVAFNARIEISAFTLLAEYVTATQTFAAGELDSVEVQPAASHIEMAYALELGGRASTFAIASQSTDEASALDVPRRRTIASVSVEILEQASLALEVARDAAYDGSNSNSITAQFAVSF